VSNRQVMVIAEHLEVRQNYSAFASYFLLSSRCLEMFVFVILRKTWKIIISGSSHSLVWLFTKRNQDWTKRVTSVRPHVSLLVRSWFANLSSGRAEALTHFPSPFHTLLPITPVPCITLPQYLLPEEANGKFIGKLQSIESREQ